MSDTHAPLSLTTEELDILTDELNYLISPKLSARSQTSQMSNHSGASTSSLNPKVSPIDTELAASRPAMSSLRGYDANNNPIYTSSQTPHDYQVMTKRKVSKKSVFNFEGVDIKHEEVPPVHSYPLAPAGPPITGGIAYQGKEKPYAAPVMDDDVHFLADINWNSQNSQNSQNSLAGISGEADMPMNVVIDQVALMNEDIATKNPRKKQLGGVGDTGMSQQPQHQHHQQHQPQQQIIYEQARPVYRSEMNYSQVSNNGLQNNMMFNNSNNNNNYMEYNQVSMGNNPNQWGNYQPQPPNPPQMNLLSQHSEPMFTQTPLVYSQVPQSIGGLPSIPPQNAVTSSNFAPSFPFSIPNINTTTPSSYDSDSYNSSPVHSQSSNANQSMLELHSNYHAILQQKVEALKLNQTPNAQDNRARNSITSKVHTPLQMNLQSKLSNPSSQSSPLVEDDSKARNRASKSLAEISRRFVSLYGKDNTMDYISGLIDPNDVSDSNSALNRVDGAAESLGVHVRRIYELIKILEILSLVTFAGDKRGKFSWKGTKDFLFNLGIIQNDGINRFPQISKQIGLLDVQDEEPQPFHTVHSKDDFGISASSVDGNGLNELAWNDINQLLTESTLFDLDNPHTLDLLSEEEVAYQTKTNQIPVQPSKPLVVKTEPLKGSNNVSHPPMTVVSPTGVQEEHFMVEIICKRFLQLFLVGMNHLTMSNVIQKLIPMGKTQSLSEYNKVNATKIRRVYDVTNVLCSLNLIRKKSIPKSKAIQAEIFNNMDEGETQHNSPSYSISDQEFLDIDDQDSKLSLTSGSTKKSKNSTPVTKGTNIEKGETKVLEWSSFSPHIIRKKYLQRIKEYGQKTSK